MVNTEPKVLPCHVGIIMDGNGRWAKQRGLPRKAGHKQGAQTFENIVKHASKCGVPFLTVYAFSSENRKRPQDEVDAILALLGEYLGRLERNKDAAGRIQFLGDIEWLDSDLRERIRTIEEKSRDREGMTLNIAFNYGGRDEILRAAKELALRYALGTLPDLNVVTEDTFGSLLYTVGQPDVDLVIRTSGEMRISNFLLWQSAYAEYVFTETLWPDFSPTHFDKALASFAGRERRMGGI